ncbi:hypothetical protein GTA51_06060 [Desulfovibrio aerotolerans]|uniref:DUF4142 domain-containing protein n=1 Tax=Solidesulfovibrio aerotolerans TaxID=295255 RepID=A0A7C9IMU7_9BACT|nr:hypothetical protein [Solidesulfovibrio aerotolerans]MYL82699.1 hypothetical protein [Solidesulfovibrio aerotolerans]
MKRFLAALVCSVCLAGLICLTGAVPASAEAPNMRQSINYFMNYFNEAVVQAIKIKEYEEQQGIAAKHPFTDEFVFFQDLNSRIEKSLGLALNLCDLYFIYNKTTYCFTKDEKNYLFDRLDNITEALQKIRDAPYPPTANLLENKSSVPAKQLAEFNERIDMLRAFIKSSLIVFQR